MPFLKNMEKLSLVVQIIVNKQEQLSIVRHKTHQQTLHQTLVIGTTNLETLLNINSVLSLAASQLLFISGLVSSVLPWLVWIEASALLPLWCSSRKFPAINRYWSVGACHLAEDKTGSLEFKLPLPATTTTKRQHACWTHQNSNDYPDDSHVHGGDNKHHSRSQNHTSNKKQNKINKTEKPSKAPTEAAPAGVAKSKRGICRHKQLQLQYKKKWHHRKAGLLHNGDGLALISVPPRHTHFKMTKCLGILILRSIRAIRNQKALILSDTSCSLWQLRPQLIFSKST